MVRMNIKILGILGILTITAVSYVSYADDDTEIVEIDEDEDFDEDDFDDWDDDEEEVEEVSTETRTVASRLTCDDIKQRVSELREDVKSHPELKSELEAMLTRQRTNCAPRANRRPVHNYENVNPVVVVDAVEVIEEEPEEVEEPVVKEKKKKVEKEPVKTPEEIAAEAAEQARKAAENLSNGLCGDGTKPNRYGCCEGEKFKETAQMKFACCPKEGDGECHEPIKKK